MEDRVRLSLRERVAFARLTNPSETPEERAEALAAHGHAWKHAMAPVRTPAHIASRFLGVAASMRFTSLAARAVQRRWTHLRSLKPFPTRGGLW